MERRRPPVEVKIRECRALPAPGIPGSGWLAGPLGLRQAPEAVGVARGVRVEADDVTLVVHAVDRGGTGRRVVDRREMAVPPGEAVGDGVVAAAGGVHADDLAPVVNAGCLGRRRAWRRQRDDMAVYPLDEAVDGALRVCVKAGDRAGVVDRGGGQRGGAVDG